MDPDAEIVSISHEIDYNPKPEDVGRVYVSILTPERPVLVFSLPAKEFQDSLTSYRWEQLDCLENDERFNVSQVDFVRMELSKLVTHVMYYSGNYSSGCALSIYITFKSGRPPPAMVQEYSFSRPPPAMVEEEYVSLEEIIEEDMYRLPVDESVMRIQEPNWNVFDHNFNCNNGFF